MLAIFHCISVKRNLIRGRRDNAYLDSVQIKYYFFNSGIKEVIFYLDGIQISVVTTPPYQISFDTNTMENGQHSIKATAIDSANNQTDYSIIVDTQNTISE